MSGDRNLKNRYLKTRACKTKVICIDNSEGKRDMSTFLINLGKQSDTEGHWKEKKKSPH